MSRGNFNFFKKVLNFPDPFIILFSRPGATLFEMLTYLNICQTEHMAARRKRARPDGKLTILNFDQPENPSTTDGKLTSLNICPDGNGRRKRARKKRPRGVSPLTPPWLVRSSLQLRWVAPSSGKRWLCAWWSPKFPWCRQLPQDGGCWQARSRNPI